MSAEPCIKEKECNITVNVVVNLSEEDKEKLEFLSTICECHVDEPVVDSEKLITGTNEQTTDIENKTV